jgi:hypothetical protein
VVVLGVNIINFKIKKRKVKKMTKEGNEKEYGLVWRGRISAGLGIGWVAFLILWLFFYASGFDIYKNIAIIVASLLAVAGFVGLTWMYGVKLPKECGKAFKEIKGLGSRMLFSIIVMITSVTFFLVWFYIYAVDFSAYQNVAIVIVQILVTFGVLGATWMTFKFEAGDEMAEGMPDCCTMMSGQAGEDKFGNSNEGVA